jgi:hypothetical protein
MPAVLSLIVNRLIRGDRIQPWPDLFAWLELFALQVDLQKRQLEDIFRHLGAAKVVP